MITDCSKVIVYDVYEDRLMRIIEFGKEEIINISFEEETILEGIQRIADGEEKSKWE